MTGILDLLIGLIFIYFLLSIICSSAVELVLAFRKTRAKVTHKWLTTVFDMQALDSQGTPIITKSGKPKTLGEAILDHCLTTALSGTGHATSYISSKNFVSALLDKITLSAYTEKTKDEVIVPPRSLEQYIEAIKNSSVISGELKRAILAFAFQAEAAAQSTTNATAVTTLSRSKTDEFIYRLEQWYDLNSDRISGNFKRRKVMPLNIAFAIIITIGLNVDTIAISKYLYTHRTEAKEFADKALRAIEKYDTIQVTGQADNALPQEVLTRLTGEIDSLKATVPEALPMGWDTKQNWKDHIAGWVATILATILGAPFWFDILNKISNLRGTGPKPATAKETTAKELAEK